jgi:hypothetical protein
MFKSLLIPGLALAAMPLMSTETTSPTTETPRPRRLGTFEQAARERGVDPRTMRNYLAKGFFPAYRMQGVVGVVLDLDEVAAALKKIPKRYAKAGFGSYGPKAVIIDIEPQVIISDDRLGGDQ